MKLNPHGVRLRHFRGPGVWCYFVVAALYLVGGFMLGSPFVYIWGALAVGWLWIAWMAAGTAAIREDTARITAETQRILDDYYRRWLS